MNEGIHEGEKKGRKDGKKIQGLSEERKRGWQEEGKMKRNTVRKA